MEGDEDQREFGTINDLWAVAKTERDEATGELVWYKKAREYWDNVPATVNGVLGGYSYVSTVDVQASQAFLAPLLKTQKKPWVALDCGAGIGRISQKLLTQMFDTTDLVELCPKFLEKAKAKLDSVKTDRFICQGLQDFTPEEGRYTVIWVQWVLGHLNDDDLVAFFERCKRGLRPGGYIVVKENVLTKGEFWLDREDSSVVRNEEQFKDAFERAGLTIQKHKRQTNFPKELFPVMMYALQ